MNTIANVAIIGAGPYGLSLAAHLAAQGVSARVFGVPMQTWSNGMPRGMLLKSEGFASSLSDPEGLFTLGHYCEEQGIPYKAVGWPVPVEVFAAYGREFARRFVPQLDQRNVERVERAPHGFTLSIEGGGRLEARHVVLATGIGHFGRIPKELAALQPDLLTHSSQHADYSAFAGREVAVIGAGASALDAAAALRRAGAEVSLVTRRSSVRFFTAAGTRRMFDSIRAPMTPLGPGWKKLVCCKAPMIFHRMPRRFRVGVVQRYLGPAPGWFVRNAVEGHVPFLLEATVLGAKAADARAALEIAQPGGPPRTFTFDHVVAATGYRVDVERLAFLDRDLRQSLRCHEGSPVLTANFESTVPGLYFVGTASALDFGPMLRFVCGAEFASRRVARHVGRELGRARRDRPRSYPEPASAYGEQRAARI